jgi:hypothetical protein
LSNPAVKKEKTLKSGDNLYDVSQVRVDHDHLEAEQNPYAPPMTVDTREIQANPETHNEFARGSAKIRVVPMLAFVVVGLLLGQYFISPQILPRSVHVLQQFRGAAIGALLGVLMYAMIEHFYPREG